MQVDAAPPLALLLLLVLLDHQRLVRDQCLGMDMRSQRREHLSNYFTTPTTTDQLSLESVAILCVLLNCPIDLCIKKMSDLGTNSKRLQHSAALGEDVLAVVPVDEHGLKEVWQEVLHARHCTSCLVNSGKVQQDVKGC